MFGQEQFSGKGGTDMSCPLSTSVTLARIQVHQLVKGIWRDTLSINHVKVIESPNCKIIFVRNTQVHNTINNSAPFFFF